jgi:predicted transposase/invertase (TIGR01784 family)
MQKKIDWIKRTFGPRDPTLLRSYLKYEKAASDEISRMNGARQEGSRNKAIEIAVKMKTRGLPLDQIAQDTGLSVEEIAKL